MDSSWRLAAKTEQLKYGRINPIGSFKSNQQTEHTRLSHVFALSYCV
jgi:hypothetical protein